MQSTSRLYSISSTLLTTDVVVNGKNLARESSVVLLLDSD